MKRTKTFTGCWTCRSRKVKCDEAKPECGPCLRRAIDCGGYDVRLQWLEPETGLNPAEGTSSSDSSALRSQRRQLLIGPAASVLNGNEVDSILRTIDSVEYTSRPSGYEDVSLTVQHFGVFRLAESAYTEPEQHNILGDQTTIDGPHEQDTVIQDIDEEALHTSDLTELFDPPSLTQQEAAANLCQLHAQWSTTTPAHSPLSATTAFNPGESTFPQALDTGTSPDVSASISIQNFPPARPDRVTPQPQLLVCDQERYLLHHYIHNVVPLLCAIDTSKSPWRTIHVPRALQSIGETSIQGSTTSILDSLKNCLLSISAFYLSNSYSFNLRKAEASRWARRASEYRCKAIGLLQHAMENDLYSSPKPKYKDFLATMLSMVSIDIMSGDTDSASVHISGAGQLINHMRGVKSKYSWKARSLHRHYLYLRLMHESTTSSASCASLPTENATTLTPRNTTQDVELGLALTEAELHSDLTSYEYTYGLTYSFLDLMKQTVILVRNVTEAREQSNNTLPVDLNQQCDSLEQKVMDFDPEEQLQHFRPYTDDSNFRIVYLQACAFHNALVIYFSQHIRLLNYRYLRQHIEKVLDSIEEIEKMKVLTQSMAAPMYWPAFIAASEAFDHKLQKRFRRWYEQVERYGIEAARTGNNVVFEVWKEGPPANDRITSLWKTVVERTGDTLLLT